MSTVLLVLLLSLSSIVVNSTTDMSALAGPPARPHDFKNPAELREYLKSLSDYFSLVGRPRSVPHCSVHSVLFYTYLHFLQILPIVARTFENEDKQSAILEPLACRRLRNALQLVLDWPCTVAFLFFFRTDSTNPQDCLPILLSMSVCSFLVFFVHFLVVGSVR